MSDDTMFGKDGYEIIAKKKLSEDEVKYAWNIYDMLRIKEEYEEEGYKVKIKDVEARYMIIKLDANECFYISGLVTDRIAAEKMILEEGFIVEIPK